MNTDNTFPSQEKTTPSKGSHHSQEPKSTGEKSVKRTPIQSQHVSRHSTGEKSLKVPENENVEALKTDSPVSNPTDKNENLPEEKSPTGNINRYFGFLILNRRGERESRRGKRRAKRGKRKCGF